MNVRTGLGAAALLSLVAVPVAAGEAFGEPSASRSEVRPPLVHTYSIVARDPESGELGVAVQSHWFSVGPIVPWAEAGVGAVATQSLVEVSYGPRGLGLMREGLSAPEALERLLAEDPQREVRQVAMVDAQGRVAVHTGSLCIADAGHETGEEFSVQANLMLNDEVWGAMATAFRNARGDLVDRMLAAMESGQAVGGDIRGQQSAAILVVKRESSGEPWADKVIDLRVEDHPLPLKELRRLIAVHRAYEKANEGDERLAARDFEGAMESYAEATRLQPENVELRFWKAASLYKEGREAEALEIFREVFEENPNWALVVPRLGGLDVLAEGDRAFRRAVERVLSVAPGGAREAGLREWERRREER